MTGKGRCGMPRVLVVEDERKVLRALERGLRAEGYEVVLAADGEEVPLTQREFEVLAYLLRHRNAVVTRDMLGRDVWKEPDYSLSNVIEVYINLLRRKLERPDRPPLIETVRGIGYTLRG